MSFDLFRDRVLGNSFFLYFEYGIEIFDGALATVVDVWSHSLLNLGVTVFVICLLRILSEKHGQGDAIFSSVCGQLETRLVVSGIACIVVVICVIDIVDAASGIVDRTHVVDVVGSSDSLFFVLQFFVAGKCVHDSAASTEGVMVMVEFRRRND